MNDEERVSFCQREIRRLRRVVRYYETQRDSFYQWLQENKVQTDERLPDFKEVCVKFEELFEYSE